MQKDDDQKPTFSGWAWRIYFFHKCAGELFKKESMLPKGEFSLYKKRGTVFADKLLEELTYAINCVLLFSQAHNTGVFKPALFI